ncbi:unnamed protein product [Lasius platythorax]|uniref:Uncharacterized protein n=1 Tax=Lasius platythorax TaxID=488582 RepID=A0AAV2MXV1_9HYME
MKTYFPLLEYSSEISTRAKYRVPKPGARRFFGSHVLVTVTRVIVVVFTVFGVCQWCSTSANLSSTEKIKSWQNNFMVGTRAKRFHQFEMERTRLEAATLEV